MTTMIPAGKLSIPLAYNEEFLKLNDEQRVALYLSLNCKKFNLIHGFPGTGKSTIISLLIKILVHHQKKVLLICYTNLAIDNILKKIKLNYHRALKQELNFENVTELKNYFDSLDLVVGTCFSFSDIVFLNRKFDFCIVDEASQQHLLLTLIPLHISRKFILVGDHLQLKPLATKSEALRMSLFEYLSKRNNVCELRRQYRMGEEIMSIANTLFYNNKMIGFGKKSAVHFVDSRKYKDIKDFLEKIDLTEKTAILCYFNIQVSHVKSIVGKKCRVETVDRFQGSESEEIILIFDPIMDCEIMCSKERLNVGITRAKNKLTLVGDKEKMLQFEIFEALFGTLNDLGIY
ncbi:hypothetical protein EDEG_01258 [Edhazardia aedis USNM 41457]|uniref:(+)RNA virus helicase C-terminal domain-containing protein n=1 Tax=Edhazardia aedis (strain USNM 41457) TaxID=1003232 RepID=J9DT93_EDHAE|nr:hypothetical protein EDEG_01258 [Edhazardia aedis USNM 41457]|eukprot:EJW04517.1 hypothetical protein EDEG_01258 [Edhazardia aedis USNM 41457]